ncbi:MAG: arsenate reductase family protein [Christensenellales bacterium]
MLFLCYPKCSTCAAAKNWLDEKAVSYTERNIKSDPPSIDELTKWLAQSGSPLKRFFNTSGLSYRALGLKDRLPAMPEEEQLRLLASDGMLVKRPILVGDGFVLVGFKPQEWESALKKT